MINKSGSSINFGANEIVMTMSGKNDCVAGNMSQIIDELDAEYQKQQQQSPTPPPLTP
ncbi:MAG: hypothetical protein ACRCSP_00055 [Rhodoglobus sp.]